VRTGRTASALPTYRECVHVVLKLSPYSFGDLPECLYFCNQITKSAYGYDRTRDIQSESQGRLRRLLCRAVPIEGAVPTLFGGAADARHQEYVSLRESALSGCGNRALSAIPQFGKGEVCERHEEYLQSRYASPSGAVRAPKAHRHALSHLLFRVSQGCATHFSCHSRGSA